MTTTTRSRRPIIRLIAASVAGLLLTACSIEGLIESGLSRVEGVGEVDIDFSEEGGTFSVTSEEGEVFGVDVDSEGQSQIRSGDGTMTTTVDGEIPPEVADAIDPPATFVAQSVTRIEETDDGEGILVQGTITGDFNALLDEIEASLDARWAQVERMVMAEGQMGTVIGHDEAEEQGVHASLMLEEGDQEGMLQIMVIQPAS